MAKRSALAFTRAYTDTDRAKRAWLADMRKRSTADLADGLAYTDLAVVPHSPPAKGAKVVARSETTITVRVPLRSGRRLAVTVAPGDCPGDWCASDVAPAGSR